MLPFHRPWNFEFLVRPKGGFAEDSGYALLTVMPSSRIMVRAVRSVPLYIGPWIP